MCKSAKQSKHTVNSEIENHSNCPLHKYCLTQKKGYESCQDMMNRYNAGLLIPPELALN